MIIYINNMIDNIDKGKEIAYAILQDLDLNQYSKEYLRVMMNFLDLDDSKILQKHIIAEKIVQIYQTYRGQYQMYLNQPKFKILNQQVREILRQLFNQYDQKIKQRKFMSLNQPKPMMSRQHIPQHMIPTPNQNMNMNMVNMFLQVPNFQSVQQIQMFQRRMFQIYKNFMPQVLNSISGQARYYNNAPYQQYSMHNMNNMPGMNTMTSIGGMSNMGSMNGMGGMPAMNNMTAMTSMSGLSGLPSMGIPGINSMSNMGTMGGGGMSGMTGIVPGMNSMTSMNYPKTPDYYQPQSSYTSRSYFQNKNQNAYNELQSQSMQNAQKNMPNNNIYRQNPMINQNMAGGSFNFYGNPGVSDDYNRGAFKGMSYSQGRINSPSEQYDRKSMYSQKFIDDQKIDNPYAPYSQFPHYAERPIAKNKQKEQKQNSQLPNSQPRKLIKKDDEVSLYNSDIQSSKQGQNPSNPSNPVSQAIQQAPLPQPSSLNYALCVCSQKNSEDICYYCKIVNIDPLNEVKQVLKTQRITQQRTQVTFTISKKTLQKVNQHPDKLDIELRCIRMDKQSQIQVVWPQKTRILIDEDFEDELSSSNNSKKKKDKPFLFSRNFGTEKNLQQKVKIVLQIKKSSEKTAQVSDYLFGIYLVERYSVQKMYDKIMQSISQTSIFQFFKTPNNQKKQQIVVSIYDLTSKKLIKDPVRGKSCTHPQCFDLSIYLSFLLLSPNRQWKCPICSKQAKTLELDSQLKKILNQPNKIPKQLKQIIFYANGTSNLKLGNQRQNEKANNEVGSNQNKNKQEEVGNNQQRLKKQLKRLSCDLNKIQ